MLEKKNELESAIAIYKDLLIAPLNKQHLVI